MQKTSEEVAKAQKLLHISYRLRYGPFFNGPYLICINVYSLGIYVMPKEGGLCLEKGTFL